MGEKHLIKTITHLWRVSSKIKKQSKQALNKLPRRKEGWQFFGYTTQNWHWFTCTRCSSVFQKLQMFRYNANRIPCKIRGTAFPVVWVSFLPFHPQPLNWERVLYFAFSKLRWWILTFLTTVILFLSCAEITFSSSNSVFSSIKQEHVENNGAVVQTDYKLVRFNSRS